MSRKWLEVNCGTARLPQLEAFTSKRRGGSYSFAPACFYGTMVYGKDRFGTKEKTGAAADWQGRSSWRALAPFRTSRN
jgi:hypothetical protein